MEPLYYLLRKNPELIRMYVQLDLVCDATAPVVASTVVCESSTCTSLHRFFVLGRSPSRYLFEYIFPETMQHQTLKLAASGQELGGDVLFPRRMGFSGTPSDLVPTELGGCQYERGTDGKVLHFVTTPEIMSYEKISPGWTVTSLLDNIANSPFK